MAKFPLLMISLPHLTLKNTGHLKCPFLSMLSTVNVLVCVLLSEQVHEQTHVFIVRFVLCVVAQATLKMGLTINPPFEFTHFIWRTVNLEFVLCTVP